MLAETLVTTLRTYRLPPSLGPVTEQRRSRWIPYAFFGFFGVVIAVNMVMLGFALGTFNGLSTEGAYDRGLGYNQELADYEAQRALGWHVETVVVPLAGGGRELVVSLASRDGLPLVGAEIAATLLRPTQAGLDQSVALREDRAGVYVGTADLPQPGQWTVSLDIAHGDDRYRYERRMTLR